MEEDILNYSPTVMFRGTHCALKTNRNISKECIFSCNTNHHNCNYKVNAGKCVVNKKNKCRPKKLSLKNLQLKASLLFRK